MRFCDGAPLSGLLFADFSALTALGVEGALVLVGLLEGVGDFEVVLGLLMLREREAGGPTGTMREPNSTPIVTS